MFLSSVTQYSAFPLHLSANMFSLSYIFIICVTIFCGANAKLPEYVHVCHRGDPALSKCILRSIETLRPQLRAGIPELGVPSLEPLVIPELHLNGGNEQTFYRAVARNVRVYGASNFQVAKLKIDKPNLTFFITVRFPFLQFFSDVEVNGRVLLTPVTARGQLENNATNVVGNAIIQAKTQNINGKNVMQFDMALDLTSADIKSRVYNLQAPPFITDIVNEALAMNSDEIFRIIKPIAEQKAAEVLLEIVNKISKNISIDEIFPQ